MPLMDSIVFHALFIVVLRGKFGKVLKKLSQNNGRDTCFIWNVVRKGRGGEDMHLPSANHLDKRVNGDVAEWSKALPC